MLEWPRPGDDWQMPRAAAFYADWRERNWGEITEQDYDEPRQRAARHALTRLRRLPSEPAAGEQRPAHAPRDRPLPDRLPLSEPASLRALYGPEMTPVRRVGQARPSRCSRLRSAKRARSDATSSSVSGRNTTSRSGRHHTSSSHSQRSLLQHALQAPSASRSTASRRRCARSGGSTSATGRAALRGTRRIRPGRTARRRGGARASHHLVADLGRRHRVHRGEHDVGVARDDLLDRRGGEVLAVDAQPVGVAAREVEEAGSSR